MSERLTRMGIGKVFLLDDVVNDGTPWEEFLDEVFHYTVRITDKRIASPEYLCGGRPERRKKGKR